MSKKQQKRLRGRLLPEDDPIYSSGPVFGGVRWGPSTKRGKPESKEARMNRLREEEDREMRRRASEGMATGESGLGRTDGSLSTTGGGESIPKYSVPPSPKESRSSPSKISPLITPDEKSPVSNDWPNPDLPPPGAPLPAWAEHLLLVPLPDPTQKS